MKLGSSAARGSREIELAEPATGWRAGDKVVFPATGMTEFYQVENGRRVIPSLLKDSETEEAEILGVDRRGILLKEPLKYKHEALGKFRGEIANLSRNVVVESADPQGIRGHTVYHRGSAGSISYAEFRHLGKKDVLGRYPIHFHLCADTMRGSSVIGASVWDSDNRWITIHGSNFLLVKRLRRLPQHRPRLLLRRRHRGEQHPRPQSRGAGADGEAAAAAGAPLRHQ
ncbi:MAG: hypothetical protein QM755_09690 [Luteolibacter sp.]